MSERYRCLECGDECEIYDMETDWWVDDAYGIPKAVQDRITLSTCCNGRWEEIDEEYE